MWLLINQILMANIPINNSEVIQSVSEVSFKTFINSI